jgi:group II intron reverse transcriptase/maturase
MGPLMGDTKDAMESENVYTKQQRIAKHAVMHPQVSFTSLAYHVDLEWLREAYRRTRKDAAVGVDRMTAGEYEVNLDERLRNLLDRFKSGTYKAPPVRRVYIPKDEKGIEKRPIGIPTLEDKILQRAVVMLLEPLYETEFRNGSYGFRPGRSQHQALTALREAIRDVRGERWVLEIDIRKFFDTLKHEHLSAMLKRRVCDGVVIRVIGKWLKAGVMEGATVHYPEEGSPQGGVISPLLSNIYLHEVLDAWFEREIQPRLNGAAKMIRFADDAVIVFESKRDAERVHNVLPKRFAKYGLALHPEKTRLLSFGKPDTSGNNPCTFDFLGFTHYWGRSRKGYWVVMRKTMKKRLRRAIVRVNQWCRVNRHEPLKEQWKTLCSKVRGHYQYYGVICNYRSLSNFLWVVKWSWRKWLGRRSEGKEMNWERFAKLLIRYPLPMPRICHSAA